MRTESKQHVIEGYYNFAITPAAHLSVHAQLVDSANPARDDPFILSTRLQIDL